MVIIADGVNIHLYIRGIYYGFITPATTQIYFDALVKGYTGDTLAVDEINLIYLEAFNYVESEQEAIDYHNQFAKEVKHQNRLALDFSVGDEI